MDIVVYVGGWAYHITAQAYPRWNSTFLRGWSMDGPWPRRGEPCDDGLQICAVLSTLFV
jgi:hypothetical protein